eukprot:CAMPEP_0179043814 /NCGR_PEP_ID=MMETSP0796-20121207/17355_1 /TAXON_ID=73915 /ORGANISM="Pyrodinium bahamense, Strain pbaha01" /LENGTH=92 /DNA_ID=CAMNT_0020740199 /DNA_START=76 /DNA_END=354 /DNA_ORIENTATION=-
MARSGATLLIACALAATLAMVISTAFVGTPGAASHSLRAPAPAVEMKFFGGEPVTTTTPPPELLADETYVVGITALFFVSLAANANGFFGPW